MATTHLEPVDDCRLSTIDAEHMTATLSWPGATPATVDGVRLEAAFSYGPARLAVTTDDISHEDGLHITLVEPDGTVADALTFRAAYTTGTFVLGQAQGDTLRFRFFGDTLWTVTVLPAPAFATPWLGLPKGVRRRRPFAKRLTVTGNPQAGV